MTKKNTTTKFIAGALAASMALTSLAASPAMAKPSNGVRILQGLAALYIISRVIEGSRNDTPPTVQPDLPRRHGPTLPRRCFRRFNTSYGVVRGYGARCLANNAPHLDLPRDCKIRVSTNRGMRKVYRKNCLRQYGYNVSRR